MTERPNADPPPVPAPAPNLRSLKNQERLPIRLLLIGGGCAFGLFLLTGFSLSPWLFLLYPLLLGGLVFSLASLALFLFRRF